MTEGQDSKEPPLNSFEAFKIALATRNMEIELFWKRSNYFLVLNTAVAAGFFLDAAEEHRLALGIFGLVIAFLWLLVNAGSKFWQSRWEQRLHDLESKLNPETKLFSSDWTEIHKDVTDSIEFSKHSWLRKSFDWLVLAKPSVSLMMELLSLAFIVLWIVLVSMELDLCR